MKDPPNSSLQRIFVLITALALSSGFSLLVYVLAKISMVGALGITLSVLLLTTSMLWVRMRADEKAQTRRYLKVGTYCGVAATLSYDLSRLILIRITGIKFWPFDIFSIFGKALVGEKYDGWWVTILGVMFHLMNGIGFSIAYVIWWGRRGVAFGILWALALELIMITIYPSWLGFKALPEFLSVSIVGHLVYGTILGFVAKRLLYEKVNKSGSVS